MSGEKTENPTPKKLREAREQGQVCKSQDISSTALIIFAFSFLSVSWPSYYANFKEMLLLPTAFLNTPFEDAVSPLMGAILTKILILSLPFAFSMALVGVAANFIQVGVLFSFKSITPSLDKLNPLSKLKEMFSMKNIIEVLKNCIKICFLGILLIFLIRDLLGPLMRLPWAGEEGIILMLSPVMKALAINVSFAYIALAAADYFFQKFQYTKQLKMSKDEVKQEYKEMEGNPEIKGKRKQLAKELAMQGNVQAARKSTVLVTNPTHYAIALDYEEGRTKLPIVIGKGEGYVAQQMILAAKEAGVPIMQNVPLAHDLFDRAALDTYIPADLIEPVAEVLLWVRQLKADAH